MDHNDGKDNVKDKGAANTAYMTNGQRCQRPRSANRRKHRRCGEV